jgi:hypothetical protein
MADGELPADDEYSEELIRIQNEEDAWKAFEDAINHRFADGSKPKIVWDGWPNVDVYLPNTPEEGSISTSMMIAFIELQNSVYKTHLLLSSGTKKRRRLTQIEREKFELRVRVEKGSSEYIVNFQEIAAKLGNDVVSKMSGSELVVTVLGLALIYAATVGFSAWLKHKTEQRKILSEDDKTIKLLENYQSQLVHDTKRYEMLTTAIETRPALKQIEYQANEARGEIVKAVADDNGGRVMGIDLAKDVAVEISSVHRQLSTEATLAGQYKVAKVDTTAADGFRVTLEDIKTGDNVTASLFDALISAEHKEIIKNAEWNKKPLFVEMAGRRLRGKIVDAKVVSVKQLEPQR